MSKFRISILIIGMLVVVAASSLLTVFGLYMTGALVTDPVELVYAVDDEEKIYDGTPLLPDHYELVSGELIKGHHAVVVFEGSQTEAGTGKSSLSVRICDEKGYEVTSEYKIAVRRGNLKVLPKDVSVVLNDEEVVYNGTKVSFEDYTVTDGGLVAGHRIAGSQAAQLITVHDTLPADLKPVVYDMAGNDVTKNYNVNFTMGNIRVVPRPVTLKPADVIKVYDGKEVVLGEVEIISGSLAEGQYFKNVEINYGLTKFDASVCDEVVRITKIAVFQSVGSQEVDVTENYSLDYISETGTVRIEKRPLTIVGKSASWEYDGGEHDMTSDPEALSYEGFAYGEGLSSVAYSGSITDAGNEVNRITGITLSGGASESNYDITYIHGTLTITKRDLTVVTPTVTKIYDGTPLKGASENAVPTALRLLDKHKIVPDEDSVPSLTDCGTKLNEFTIKIVNADDGAEKDLSGNYNIVFYYGEISVTPYTVYVETPTVTAVFDGNYHYGFEKIDDLSYTSLVGEHKLKVSDSVEKPGLKFVGKILNELKVSVEDGDGQDVTKNYNISYQYGHIEITPFIFTITTGSQTKEYDATELKAGADETDFGEADSLPAFNCTLVESDKNYPGIINAGRVKNFAEYKLEYISGGEVDPVNYEIIYEYGYLEITPYRVELKLNPISKAYSKTNFAFDATLKEDALKGNDSKFDSKIFPKSAVVLKARQAEIIEVGTYSYTADISSSYNKNNYILIAEDGELTITKYVMVIDDLPAWEEGSNYQQEIYDGLPHTLGGAADVLDNSYLVFDLTYDDFEVVQESGDFENAGMHYYSVRLNNDGMAKNIEVKCVPGSLKIIPFPITVALIDYEYTYDAKEHLPGLETVYISCKVKNYENGSMINEIRNNRQTYLEMYCSKTVKDADEYKYGVRLKPEYSVNYQILVDEDGEEGIITINPIRVRLGAVSYALSKSYDKTVYSISSDEVVISNLVTTELQYTYTVNLATSSADVSDEYRLKLTANELTFYYMGEDITRNFTVTNEIQFNVSIYARKISFVLDNYLCNTNTKPRTLTDEFKKCLTVSSLTPLFEGYYIEFSVDDLMQYNPSRNTLTVERDRLTDIVIRDEKGRNVTQNFEITNEDDLTAAIIVID